MTHESTREDIPLLLRQQKTVFMGMEFEVGRGALVPRRDTELLCNTVLDSFRTMAKENPAFQNPIVIDLCCGVGNLGIAIAANVPGARVYASDLLPSSTELAIRNVKRHGLEDRVTILTGDLFQPYANLGLEGTVAAIVCNPPYISTQKLEKERQDILEHEPREAFDAGPYGLAIHQRTCRESTSWLVPGGFLAFEYGAGQGRQLQILFDRTRRFGPVRNIELDSAAAGVAIAFMKQPATQIVES
jgi:release factor glutamine methyltransferase